MNCQTPRRKDGALREGKALVTEVLENCALRKIHFRVTHLPCTRPAGHLLRAY